jgi:hypothetical protein
MITGLQPQPSEVLESTGLSKKLGPHNLFARTGPAIDSGLAEMELGICATCPYTAFRECSELKLKGVAETLESRKESI